MLNVGLHYATFALFVEIAAGRFWLSPLLRFICWLLMWLCVFLAQLF